MISPAKKILMIRPSGFGFNPQTAESNKFQRSPDIDRKEISRRAAREFDAMTSILSAQNVDVVVIEDSNGTKTPDAVFPNNWFSTHPDGTFCLYPMEAKTRRLERSAAKDVLRHFDAKRTLDLTDFEKHSQFLEGTGSLILDHTNRIAFAGLSSRTDIEVLKIWASEMNFSTVTFNATDGQGAEIYHTNVMMCLGDKYAVACVDSFRDQNEKANFVDKIHQTNRLLVEISIEQMNSFAGNMLQIATRENEKLLLMSAAASSSLDSGQRKVLESFNRIVSFEIDTIEACGGGSVRCMIAEIFDISDDSI